MPTKPLEEERQITSEKLKQKKVTDDTLKTEQKISGERKKQQTAGEKFRSISAEIKDSLHNLTLDQQNWYRSSVTTKENLQFIKENLQLSSVASKAESDTRENIVKMMKEGVKLGAESLTDVSKHGELDELIAQAEQEKVRVASQFRGANLEIGKNLQANLDVLIKQITAQKEFALEQKKVQELTETGTNMMMAGFDDLKSKIESFPGGELISKSLQLDMVGEKLKGAIGDNLKTMLDPKNLDPKKMITGFQNIGKAGVGAFGAIGKAIWKVTAALISSGWGAIIVGVAVALVAVVSMLKMAISRFKEIDKAAESFRTTTGLTKTMTEGLDTTLLAVNKKYRDAGITIGKAVEAATALHDQFGRMNEISEDTVGAIALMNTNFGIAEETSAGAMKNLMVMGNMSAEHALNLQAGAISLAEASGVAPVEVMESIAKAGKSASFYFAGNTKELIRAAVYARRLGLEMNDLTGMADNLLDFENSINAEMEASVLVGRRLNFEKARQLAWDGNLQGAAEAALDTVGSISDFNALGPKQKEAIAKAAGLEVAQLQQALERREEMAMLDPKERIAILEREKMLGKLNQKTREGILLQKEMQGLGSLMSAFWGKIKETVGNLFLPIIKKVSGWMQGILSDTEKTNAFFGTLSSVLSVIGSVVMTIGSMLFRWYKMLYGWILPVFKTIGGVIEFLKGIGQALIGIFTGDLDLIKTGINNLVGGIKKVFVGIFDIITYPFRAAWGFVTGIFEDLVNFIGGIFGMEGLGTKIVSGLTAPFKLVWAIITHPFKLVWSFLKAIPLIGTLFGGGIGGNQAEFLSTLGAPFKAVWDIITWPFRTVLSFLQKIPIIGTLFGGGAGGDSGGFLSMLGAPLKLVWDIITWPFRTVLSFLQKIPLIGKLFGGGGESDSGGFLSILASPFKAVWDIITMPFRLVRDFLKKIPLIGKLFGGGGESDSGGFLSILASPFKGVWDIITMPFRLVWHFLQKIPLIGRLFGGTKDGDSGGFLSILASPFKAIWDIITMPFRLALNFLRKIPIIGRLFGSGGAGEEGGDFGIGSIVSAAFGVFGGAASLVKNAWGGVKGVVSGAWNGLKSAGSGIFEGIKSIGSGIFGAFKSDSSKLFESMESDSGDAFDKLRMKQLLFSGIGGTVFKSLGTIGGKAWDKIKDVGGSALEGLKDKFGSLKEIGSKVFGGIKELGSTAFSGIKGLLTAPFKDAGETWNKFKEASAGALDSVSEMITNLSESDTAQKLKAMAGEAWTGVKDIGTKAMASVSEMAAETWAGIKSIGASVVEGVKGMADTTWEGIKSVGGDLKDVGEKAWSGVKGLFAGGKELASDMLDNLPFKSIGDKLSGLVSGFGNDVTGSLSEGFTGEKFTGILTSVKDKMKGVFDTISSLSPFKVVSNIFQKITGGEEEATVTEAEKASQKAEELNERLVTKLDEVIAAIELFSGGDVIMDGATVGKRIAKSTTSAVRG